MKSAEASTLIQETLKLCCVTGSVKLWIVIAAENFGYDEVYYVDESSACLGGLCRLDSIGYH